MDIGAGILAGGQGLARGIDQLGVQFQDYRERQAAQELLSKLGMFGPQNPIPAPQQAQSQTLASLGQPTPQPIAQQNPGNATTAQLPQISPANRGVSQGFANEMGQKWAQNPGQIGGAVPALAGLSAPSYSSIAARGLEQGSIPQRQAMPSQAMAFAGGGLDQSGRAISGIESGGRYDALGPVIPKSGDRAFGKYQVMGANIGPWTEKYLGRAMTPQEFLANPQAQEAVFQGEFGRLSQKYGPEGAARAWFAGEGGMNDPNRRDVLGTSVSDYSSKFVAGGGAGQGNPLANVTPMQGGQQPTTLAQLSAPPQAGPQFDMQTLGALMTNKYTAPIGQAIIAKQLGRDPIEQQLRMVQLQQAQNSLNNTPIQQQMLNEQLRAAQLGNQQKQAEISGESTATTPDMKEFALAKRQGFPGTFLDYQQAKSAAKQKPGLSAADQKVIFAEEDQLPAIDSTIETLRRAKELNGKTFTGAGAGVRGAIGTMGIPGAGLVVDEEKAKATREFGQIMSMEAIKSMSSLLKGATTDKEMMEFQRLLSDPTTPPDIRQRTIDRMLTLAERQKQIATGRINELRSKGGLPAIGGAPAAKPQNAQDPLGIR